MTFKSDLDSDLGHMLRDDEFGIEATFKPAVGSEFTLDVIFDNEHVGVDVGDESPVVSGQKPVARVRLSDFLTDPAQGDQIEIDSVDYNVTDIEPDGTGAADLILEVA